MLTPSQAWPDPSLLSWTKAPLTHILPNQRPVAPKVSVNQYLLTSNPDKQAEEESWRNQNKLSLKRRVWWNQSKSSPWKYIRSRWDHPLILKRVRNIKCQLWIKEKMGKKEGTPLYFQFPSSKISWDLLSWDLGA